MRELLIDQRIKWVLPFRLVVLHRTAPLGILTRSTIVVVPTDPASEEEPAFAINGLVPRRREAIEADSAAGGSRRTIERESRVGVDAHFFCELRLRAVELQEEIDWQHLRAIRGDRPPAVPQEAGLVHGRR